MFSLLLQNFNNFLILGGERINSQRLLITIINHACRHSKYIRPLRDSIAHRFSPVLLHMDLHYKKDGTLDMRYKSSKEYVASHGGASAYRSRRQGGRRDSSGTDSDSQSGRSSESGAFGGSVDELHYKKDGTLDM